MWSINRMAKKKEVRKRPVHGDGLWDKAKKKLRESTGFVKRQQFEWLQIFKSAKTSTKVVVTSVILGVFLFVVVSVTHSLNSISEKKKAIEEIERQIEIQQRLNEEIENELKGNMDEIIEGRARELDMVYPDEEVFINNAG